MTIKQFIEKAIEGGWKGNASYFGNVPVSSDGYHTVLLDPEAWKAVGKVEGWRDPWRMGEWRSEDELTPNDGSWLYNMHRMIDALAEGKTIEQYLETL